jgi:hypothetical protein
MRARAVLGHRRVTDVKMSYVDMREAAKYRG